MAFTSANLTSTGSAEIVGSRKMSFGSYTSSASGTGGDIATGLNIVDAFSLQPYGSAVATNAPVVNETFPLYGSDVTIVTDADEVGSWIAYGR